MKKLIYLSSVILLVSCGRDECNCKEQEYRKIEKTQMSTNTTTLEQDWTAYGSPKNSSDENCNSDGTIISMNSGYSSTISNGYIYNTSQKIQLDCK